MTGSVLNGETLEPIAGATLEIVGTEVTVVTDINGKFAFPELAQGSIDIRVNAKGYDGSLESLDVGVGGIEGQVFVLLRAGLAGETIEVREKARAPKAPGKQELRREELTRIPGARGDALTSLKSLPGVAAADAQGSGPGLLVIRGAAPEDSVILLDGIEVPLVYHFGGLQSILPSEFIETIDFAPGGFGAEKGRATGGVIEINTRNKTIDEWKGFAELSFINFAALVQGPVWKEQNVQGTLALRRSAIDLVLPLAIPDDSSIQFTTAPVYYDGQLRLDWFPKPAHRVSFLGLGSLDLLTLLAEMPDPNEPLLTGKFENQTDFSRAITTWAYEEGRISNRLVSSFGTGGFRFEIGSQRFLRISQRRAEIRNDTRYEFSDRLQFRAGAEARYARGRLETKVPLPPGEGGGTQSNFSTRPIVELDEEYQNNILGAYVTADINSFPGLTVTPGVRADYFARMELGTVSPRLAVRYGPPEADWTVKLALGSYTRPLQQAEAFQDGLEAEKADQYVLGGEYALGGGFEASSSAFFTDRSDLVVLDEARNQVDPRTAYVSRGTGRSYGAEALLRARRDNFFGWIAYTVSRSERVDDPLSELRLFSFDQTHNFLIVGSYKIGGWDLSGRWQLATGVPTTPVVGSRYLSDANIYIPVYGTVNSERYPTSHQLDIRIDRKWEFDSFKLSVYLDIANVYANPKQFEFAYNFDYSERQAIEELPILPAIGIRGSF